MTSAFNYVRDNKGIYNRTAYHYIDKVFTFFVEKENKIFKLIYFVSNLAFIMQNTKITKIRKY